MAGRNFRGRGELAGASWFPQLARRLSGPGSIVAAPHRDTLAVGQAVAVLSESATVSGIVLAWPDAGVVRLPAAGRPLDG